MQGVHQGTEDMKLIFNDCMGSGTTGVACVKNNRDFIGIEKDATFYDIALNRIGEAIKEKQLKDDIERSKQRLPLKI